MFFKVINNKWVGLSVGLAFTLLVAGLIFYRAFIVEPIVPKPRFWGHTPIPVNVCPGAHVGALEEAAVLVPACDFEFRVKEAADCICPTVAADWSKVNKPIGYVEVVGGPSDGHEGGLGRTAFSVRNPTPWVNPETKSPEPSGAMVGACVVIPTTGSLEVDVIRVAAHELAHACGYAHAVGDPTSPTVRLHLMSAGHGYQGEDSRGMTLKANEIGQLGDGLLKMVETDVEDFTVTEPEAEVGPPPIDLE